jgi:NitT/TauT family transport system permease protein
LATFSLLEITIDILFSWIRMIAAFLLSIAFSLVVGILAARNKRAESIIIPLLDVFQSIPILGFFPLVILGIIAVIPGQLGVNLAVIILIFTSMSWNIAFGVYEAVKSIPQDYIDLSSMSNTSTWQRITSLYIPASMSRIAYNTQTSWAVGLFYLVSSEILTLGQGQCSPSCQVNYGIGVATMTFYYIDNNITGYIYSVVALIIAVVIWQFVFLREFAIWAERYKFVEEPRAAKKDPLMRFYSWVNHRSISKLFLFTHDRGVTRFSSSLTRFRRGIKYAILILVAIFAAFEAGAIASSGVRIALPSLSRLASAEGTVLAGLAVSFLRVWYVYFICSAVALPAGIAIGLRKELYEALSPILEVVASIPAPILLPVIIVAAARSGEVVAAIIIFLGMIWYIIFNVMGGIRSLPNELWELRKEFNVSKWSAWRNIYIPSVMTAFVTGSITAVGAAWNTLIVAEYFVPFNRTQPVTQVSIGIGKIIVIAANNGDLLTLTLAILSMTAIIVAFNLTVWRRVYHYVTKKYTYNR